MVCLLVIELKLRASLELFLICVHLLYISAMNTTSDTPEFECITRKGVHDVALDALC